MLEIKRHTSISRLLTLWAAVALLGCGQQAGGDARRVIVGEPEVAVVVPSVEALRAHVVAFLAGIEGASGVLELAEGRYGVDLTSADGVRAAGVDPAGALVAFERGGGLILAAGVVDDDAFVGLVAERLRRGAGGGEAARAGAGLWRVDGPASGADRGARWRAAWGVTEDHVGIFALTPAAGDPEALWREAAAGRGEFLESDLATRARERAGQGAALWFVGGDVVPEAPASLGVARGVVGGALDGLQRIYGGVALADDRLGLRVSVDNVGERELPVSWVQPEGASDVFAGVFPKTTAALIRVRFNTAKVRRYPSILRKRLLPDRIPGTAGMPLPGLDEALELTDGDFAVALLGIDPAVTVQHLINYRRTGRGLDKALHLALAARLRDVAGAVSAFDAVGTQLRTSGWTVAEVNGGGGARGWTFHRGDRAYSALIKGDVLVFLTGAGEVEPFLAVGEERALPLASVAEGEPVAAAALGLEPATAGVVLGFTRVARELHDKGVPPYFLKIVNDIRVLAAAVNASERRIDLDLDVAL